MSKEIFRRENCRLCESRDLSLVFQLAPTPPANAFVSKDETAIPQKRYPLDLFFCKGCGHLQLLDVVDPEILFRNYVYVSGTSPVFVNHFKEYADWVTKEYSLNSDGFVFEIGSNDGTLLRQFKDKGMQVLGVDPALSISEAATKSGIETLPLFFGSKVAQDLAHKYSKADLVLANNVFAHIDDLKGVTEGVREFLKPNGVFVFEVSYLVDVFEKTLFDTIYHEHLDYHAVKPLQTFFELNGMKLIDVKRVDSHGGSLRGVAALKGASHSVKSSVAGLIAYETNLGLFKDETYKTFESNINALGKKLRDLIASIKSEGKKIAGFGAPAKATTLMYQFGIQASDLEYIVDDSPLKQGLYSPGLHVPVKTSNAIYETMPDYLLVLAWNFADPIMAKHAEFKKNGGRFIVPVPDLKVV